MSSPRFGLAAPMITAACACACSAAICLLPLQSAVLNPQIRAQLTRTALVTQRPNNDIALVAHRGAARFAPENTLPAIEAALDRGARFIELDVRSTKDGVPVLLHDGTVDRTTNGSGAVSQLTLAELRQLDAGSWFGEEFAGTRIPTLEEALQTIAGRGCAFWDPKSPPTRTMVSLFQRYGFTQGCLLVAFGPLGKADDETVAEQVLSLWPLAPIMPSAKRPQDVAQQLSRYPQAAAFRVMRSNLQPEVIAAAHAAGVPVFSSTLIQADTPENYRRVVDAGVDMVMLDDIAAFNAMLNR